MIELGIGSVITLTSLLIGFSLGKHESALPPDMKKKITHIFNKVAVNKDVGAIPRPTKQDNFYRDNPQVAREHEVMSKEFDKQNG